ncbi:chaperone protein dnaJ 16-like isoform X1 [Mangifera indica]|uniref:chaperone protein dnaJ 16-like isoform X1 n=1 Tax=Mangifera indica TaxID=29780 RepID=UPI001CFB73F5|nr:chaperone protein dnaJ 16-like isoform X1 [Mangifera indica]
MPSYLFLLHFDQDGSSGLSLALQEDNTKTEKVTAAGMYFLGFLVHQLDQTANLPAAAKDPDAASFKKLDILQPCEITELKAGTHTFAVYGQFFSFCSVHVLYFSILIWVNFFVSVTFLLGDNFFFLKSASCTIEFLCAAPFKEEKENLRAVEAHSDGKIFELCLIARLLEIIHMLLQDKNHE